MERAIKLFALFFFFYLAGWGEVGRLKAVPVQPNRSIILGQVQEVERDFPQVILTIRVIKSYALEEYANLIKENEIIQIEPSYTGKEFKIASFFEDERNLNNLQAYYFLVGDYFFAEVSLLGDERGRGLYLTIQRVNQESALRAIERPDEFLKSYGLSMLDELPSKPPREYAKLASILYELINSPDRSDFAKRHQLYLSQGKVRVIIELLPEFEEIEGDYGVMVEGRTDTLIKALVPIDQLGLLAKDPSVRFIRPPHKPIPLPRSTSKYSVNHIANGMKQSQ